MPQAGGGTVGVAAAKDYVYGRLEKLGQVILSERGPRREEAKKERDFLLRELEKVLRKGRGTVEVDPGLAREVRRRGLRGPAAAPRELPLTVFPLKIATKRPAGGDGREPGGESGSAAAQAGRPPYRAECAQMDFRGLREFIDVSLRTPPGPEAKKLPRSKREFQDLLMLLADKGGIELDGELRPVADAEEDDPKLRKMRMYRKKLAKALAQAQHEASVSVSMPGRRHKNAPKKVRDLREELGRLGSELTRLEALRKAALANPRTEKQKLRRLKAMRVERVGRVKRDIERVFAEGGPGVGPPPDLVGGRAGGRRLPWRVLPPGELTLAGVLAHYERLARQRPDARFEPERIEKAHSLGPDAWWGGSAGFGGYVVFEYPGTDRVLLECGLYGNAIYVLGPDWQRLSRLSKRQVLEDPSTRKIVHRGEWFATVKAELGLR